ncbi:hypothetical protein [Pseudomonas juntendi]|uniref:hypothetical protein n=1 Tax=Pseudomonas juntendi TaxID=2666183 RepID=UPI003B9361E3
MSIPASQQQQRSYCLTIRLDAVGGGPEQVKSMLGEVLENLMEHKNACVPGSVTNARVTAVLVESEDDQGFSHAGARWDFDSDQLVEWDEDDGLFHFRAYHGLAEPTVESVCRFIDQLQSSGAQQ